MRIRYVVPGPMGSDELQRRGKLLKSWAPSDVQIEIEDTSSGPSSIECTYEEHLSIPGLAERLLSAEAQGIDAMIVGCADDPGVDALREIATRTAVIGPMTAAMHVACQLGERFAIVTVPTVGAVRRLVQAQRLNDCLLDIGVVDIPVLSLGNDPEETASKVIRKSRELADRGADTIVLGCMSLAFLDRDAELIREIGTPVVNPAKVGIGTAATIVRAGLMPSKVAYPTPPKVAAGQRLVEFLSPAVRA